jgi:hypothetical protein
MKKKRSPKEYTQEQVINKVNEPASAYIVELNKNTTRQQLDNALKKIVAPKRKINLDKYAGKIKFKTDGLAYQKKVRDEWR